MIRISVNRVLPIMAWEPVFWFLSLILSFALFGLTGTQYLALDDLEADRINAFDLSSRIKGFIVWEFLLHGVFCFSLLVTGHWIMFLLTLPLAFYNMKLYLSRQHLIDVTEIFRVLHLEINIRLIKMGFYVALVFILFLRFVFSLVFTGFADDDDIRGFAYP